MDNSVPTYVNRTQVATLGAITSDSPTITLEEGEGELFPELTAEQYMPAVILNPSLGTYEEIDITSRSGDVLNVVRARGGTLEAPWASGSKLFVDLPARELDLMRRTLRISSGEDAQVLVDGSPVLTVDGGTRNVGVGTASPVRPFHIEASGGATLRVKSSTTGSATVELIAANDDAKRVFLQATPAAGALDILNASSARLGQITQSGLWGIGIGPAPGNRFQVGTTATSTALTIEDATGVARIQFDDLASLRLGAGDGLRIGNNGTASAVYSYGASLFVGTQTANSLFLLTNGSTAVSIDATRVVRLPHDTTGALRIGADDGLRLWRNGSDSYVWSYTGGLLLGTANGNVSDLYFQLGGSIVARFDQSVNSAFVVGTAAAQSGSKFDVQTTGQAHALVVDDVTGNLGIGGVPSSSAQLHVYRSSGSVWAYVQTGSASDAGMRFRTPTRDWGCYVTSANDFVIRDITAGVSCVTIFDGTGNATFASQLTASGSLVVGAAAAQSGSKLDVQTTGQPHAMYIADADGTMHFPWSGAFNGPNIGIGASEEFRIFSDGTTNTLYLASGAFRVQNVAAQPIQFYTSNLFRGDISATGAWRIGSTALQAGAKLDVQTAGQAHAMYIADADGTMHFPWDGSSTAPNIALGQSDDMLLFHDGNSWFRNQTGELILYNNSPSDTKIVANNATSGNIRFYTRGAGSPQERCRVTANGLQLLPLASDPGSPTDGDIWITTGGDLKLRAAGTSDTVLTVNGGTGGVVIGTSAIQAGAKLDVQTTGQAHAMYISDANGTMHLPWAGGSSTWNINIHGRLGFYHSGAAGSGSIRCTEGDLFLTATGGSSVLQAGGSSVFAALSSGAVQLYSQPSAPSGALGRFYVDSSANKLYFHNGTSWKEVAFV